MIAEGASDSVATSPNLVSAVLGAGAAGSGAGADA